MVLATQLLRAVVVSQNVDDVGLFIAHATPFLREQMTCRLAWSISDIMAVCTSQLRLVGYTGADNRLRNEHTSINANFDLLRKRVLYAP
jgi:hypothetical protein